MSGESSVEYTARINHLGEKVSQVHELDLFAEKDANVTPPTMAFSAFLINKEQGDWAEELIGDLLNENLSDCTAVEYGRGEDRVAGEPGFNEYYRSYHQELADIGKCPDLLLFRTDEIDQETIEKIEDIEGVPRSNITETVRPAVAGLEVRSSSYLAEKYSQYQMRIRKEADQEVSSLISTISNLSQKILDSDDVENKDRLQSYIHKVIAYGEATAKEEAPIYRTTAPIKRMAHANLSDSEANTFLETADEIREVQKSTFKRDYLSVTAKVEDLVVILKWIETHQIPHYYIQVFFDSIYLLSFEHILRLLSDPSAREDRYHIQQHEKNQMKRTIHIDINEGQCLTTDLQVPATSAEFREHPDGRLQNYVSFQTPEDEIEGIMVDREAIQELFQ